MTNVEKPENPTEPVPAASTVSTAEPSPKKRRNVGKVLSIATVAAGIACVLAATFGVGLMVGEHAHHHHGHRDRAAGMFIQGGPGDSPRHGGQWNGDRGRDWGGDRGHDWGRDRDRGGHGDRDQQGDRDGDNPGNPGWQRTSPNGPMPGSSIPASPAPNGATAPRP